MNGDSVSNSRELKALFLEEMKGVAPIKSDNRAEIDKSAETTPGQEERRKAAVRSRPWTRITYRARACPLLPEWMLAYKKGWCAEWVFRKLRLAQYPLEARLICIGKQWKSPPGSLAVYSRLAAL